MNQAQAHSEIQSNIDDQANVGDQIIIENDPPLLPLRVSHISELIGQIERSTFNRTFT